MIVGHFEFPSLEEVFGDVLPKFVEATKADNPIRAVAALIKAHPEKRGVLTAYLSLTIAKTKKDRNLALKVLVKAKSDLVDDYLGLIYATWCGVGIILNTQEHPPEYYRNLKG
jgi:hypothetical protein